MAKITYTDKVSVQVDPTIPDINKVTDADMNEIKDVVNDNYDYSIYIGDEADATSDTKLLIETDTLASLGTEITNTYSTSQVLGYSANYVNNLQAYSTTEQRIGTWIDGKPLYRKVIECGSLPNNNTKNIAHDISNLDIFTKIYIFGINPSGNYHIAYSVYDNTTVANSVTAYANSTNVVFITKSDRSAYTGYAILEYTKTTD